MKFTKIALIAAMAMAGVNAAHADTVTFTGSIIDAPCSITPDTADQTVDLGEVASHALENGGASSPRPFSIDLENCDISDATQDEVSVTFSGGADAVDNTMLGLTGSAAGAGIVIADQSGAGKIDLNTASNIQKLQTGDNTLQFSAYLQGEGASATIVPGDFTSVANFTLAYQ